MPKIFTCRLWHNLYPVEDMKGFASVNQ